MRVCVENYGCTMNQGEGLDIMRSLSREHSIVRNAMESDIVIINSCGVVEKTERRMLRRFKELRGLGKEVIMTGCLPAINPEAVENAGVALIAPIGDARAINDILLKRFYHQADEHEKVHSDTGYSMESIIQISDGCLGSCSYCATKRARGGLKSRGIEAILKDVEVAIAGGCKEIRLTALDTSTYGIDIGRDLPELLDAVIEIPGEFRVRVGMMNPRFAKGILSRLVDAYDDEKVYKFLHLPIQSGDDELLRSMNRGYTTPDFVDIVSEFRERFEDMTLSTDVITGFPGETDESFSKTCTLLEQIKPEIINITRFSARPGTPAFRLKDMPNRFKTERSRKLTKLHRSMSKAINERFIRKVMKVLITEKGKNNTLMGRTNSYRAVVLRNGRLGELIDVKIKGATASYLIAE